MAQSIFPETRALEDAFFHKRDAELIAEMRRREAEQNRRKALAEVSGITDESVLDQLVEHDIHAETLAAFSLIPVIEVAWSDGKIQPEECKILLQALADAGIQKDGVACRLVEHWMDQRPNPKLMEIWKNYTRVLISELSPEAGESIKETIMRHARAVAEAAGGFLGFARLSRQEEEALRSIEEAFHPGKE